LTDKETGEPVEAEDFRGDYWRVYKGSDAEFLSLFNAHDCYILFNP